MVLDIVYILAILIDNNWWFCLYTFTKMTSHMSESNLYSLNYPIFPYVLAHLAPVPQTKM